MKSNFRNGSREQWTPGPKKKKVQNTKKLEALAEIRKQHLFMFYFSLVKIYIIYITHTEESHSSG